MFEEGKSLSNEPIGIILRVPDLLDFNTKKMIFRKHPKF